MSREWTDRARRAVFSHLYLDSGGPDDRVYVAGGGRGGTTWVATVLAELYDYRLVFEPFFHMHLTVDGIEDFFHHRYIPLANGDRYREAIDRVMACRHRAYRINRHYRLRYSGRVIKDICSNGFLPVLRTQNPRLPIVLVVRHPGAVAASRLRKGEWTDAWGRHAQLFKDQPAFVRDLLGGSVREPLDEFDDHLLSYCMENLVPARLLRRDVDYLHVAHEKMLADPEAELRRIAEHVTATCGVVPT
jgi:hypothetical protein